MSLDRYFSRRARAAKFKYLLGLGRGRDPSKDPRSPRVIWFNPGFCARLEKFNPHRNSSTNFVISLPELVSDSELLEITRSYIEDYIMAGVPPAFYACVVIAHRERRKGTANGKRSAAHIKIVNLRLPAGGHLQPFYPRRERFMTTLFLADLALKKNWPSPLDPGRERLGNNDHKHCDILPIKRAVDEVVKAAKRRSDGTPDPENIMRELRALGIEKISPTKGVVRKKGITFRLTDHPKPVRFFGPEYASVHDLLNSNKEPPDDQTKPSKKSQAEEYFPNGVLERTKESADKIASGLERWRKARIKFNTRKYKLKDPVLMVGGYALDPDPLLTDRMGIVHRRDDSGEPKPARSTGQIPKRAERESANLAASEQDPLTHFSELISREQSNIKTYQQNEYTTDRPSRRKECDPLPRRTCPHLGIIVAAIVAVISRILREVYWKSAILADKLDNLIESRGRRAREIAEADSRIGSQGRSLDQAIAELAADVARLGPREVSGKKVSYYSGQSLRRVDGLVAATALPTRPPEEPEEKKPGFEIEP
jgi:hypothetical protein